MNFTDKIRDNKFLNNKIFHIILLVLAAIYPLRWTFTGLDLWDAGYNCVNYVNFSPEVMTPKLFFSMYLSGALGHVFTYLPLGGTYAGLRFYCGLIISANVLITGRFLIKDLDLDGLTVFLGELLAVSLCYSPTVILYNHLSFLLLDIAIILIYKGLKDDKGIYLAWAGVLLAANVYVRFSNLTQALLITAVWFYCFIKKTGFTEGIKKTLTCLLGYLVSGGLIYVLIGFKYGMDAYIKGIGGLFAMTEGAAEYTPLSMLVRMFDSYIRGARRLVDIILFAAGAFIVTLLIGKLRSGKEDGKEKISLAVSLVFSVLLCAYLVWARLMQFDFHHYITVILTATMFIDLVLILCIIRLFTRQSADEERLMALLVILLVTVLSVGSNTSISPVMNSMFLIAPYMIYVLVNCVKLCKPGFCDSLKKVGAIALATFFIQCLLFGGSYCYEEANNGAGGKYVVQDNPVIAGIRMDEDRAAALSDLTAYVKDIPKEERGVIIYGYAPALAYYLDLEPVMTSWPDLASYNYPEMEKDMAGLEEKMKGSGMAAPMLIIDKEGIEEQKELAPKKWDLISDLMEEHAYSVVHENARFTVFRAR